MISGLWDVPLASKTNHVYLWRPQITSTKRIKQVTKSFLKNVIVVKFRFSEIQHFDFVGKGTCRKVMTANAWKSWGQETIKFGGVKTMGVNDRVGKTENRHGGISIKTLRS